MLFKNKHSQGSMRALTNTQGTKLTFFSKVQDRKRFSENVSGLTHVGAKVLMAMKFSGEVS
jgi:hypothetical protein